MLCLDFEQFSALLEFLATRKTAYLYAKEYAEVFTPDTDLGSDDEIVASAYTPEGDYIYLVAYYQGL